MSNKAIFFDRDDTLIEDPGYINDPDQVKLLDGVAEALVELGKMGYKLIVVSNQSGVARGIVTEKVLGQIHDRLKELLAEKKAYLDGIYYCPYHSEGVVAKYRKESSLRKPEPGMLITASDEMDLDLVDSWMVGDSGHDIQAGQRAGCRTILIDNSPQKKTLEPFGLVPDYRAVNIKEVVNIVKKYHRSSVNRSVQDKSSLMLPLDSKPEANEELAQGLQISDEQNFSEKQSSSSEQLLSDILRQLKNMQRSASFDEFSITKVIAGIVQGFAILCLLISVYLLMDPAPRGDMLFISLGFAIVLQMMALTFYIMQGRK